MSEPYIFALIAFGIKIDFSLLVHAVLYFLLSLSTLLIGHLLLRLNLKWSKALAFGFSALVSLTTEINDGLKWWWNHNNFFGLGDLVVSLVFAIIAVKFGPAIIAWLKISAR